MENYKVIKAIGKGSFGKVYLVHHVKENKKYVLKVIKVKGMPVKERCVLPAPLLPSPLRACLLPPPHPFFFAPNAPTHPPSLLPTFCPQRCLPQ